MDTRLEYGIVIAYGIAYGYWPMAIGLWLWLLLLAYGYGYWLWLLAYACSLAPGLAIAYTTV